MNNINHLIEKSRKTPALAPIYAMEVDRQLRSMGKAPLTFSAKGLADGDAEIDNALSIVKLFDAQPTPQVGGAIYQAEKLVKDSKVSEAIAHAFTHAHGAEINALNLLYANYATSNPKLRLHFLNKYLSTYGLGITLQEADGKEFFHQIKSAKTPERVDGPLVTIIMPAYNAEGTINQAVSSLLNQSWHNLQIIVVDDASTDDTLQKAKDLAKRDKRVEVLSNPVNVGPYVCRNLGVLHTRGQWLTVHDADDWAFPDRIEQQVRLLTKAQAATCTGSMLRINELGQITRPVAGGASIEEDGYLRLCFASLMVETAYFRDELGAWDSVRVGGDAELIDRITALGTATTHLIRPMILCLDHKVGLINHQEFGPYDVKGKTLPIRSEYSLAYKAWNKSKANKRLSFFGKSRPFEAPKGNLIKPSDMEKVFSNWSKNLQLIKASEIFDEKWYCRQYPEYNQTCLDAAEHYLVHGATGATNPSPSFSSRFYLVSRSITTNPLVHHLSGKDTGPIPKRVMLAAADVARAGEHERAIALAEAHLSPNLTYTAHILKANAALSKCDEAGWQEHLNAYLAHFNVAPICLDVGEGSVFDRLNTASLPLVTDGPLVTVIMPAWNSENTVNKAAQSILNQTWRNLELLIVDDASTDSTWDVLQNIANSDVRVKIIRNEVNVGPYVSKNIALMQAKGEWITGHDADDWAHPNRLKDHIFEANSRNLHGSLAYMIRFTRDGFFSNISMSSSFTLGGTARKALISCLFKRSVLIDQLGYWDSVRFGADSEMIYRAEKVLGDNFGVVQKIVMICLDLETSLTNHAVQGIDKEKGISSVRASYRDSWMEWLQNTKEFENCYLAFPQQQRRYTASLEMVVSPEDVASNLSGLKND